MNLYVIGRWGEGTSLIARIAERHGVDFGHEAAGQEDRNPHGMVEDFYLCRAHEAGGEPALVRAALEALRERAPTSRIGIKMPWMLVHPATWPVYEAVLPPSHIIWVHRPSKRESAYTMHPRRQPQAVIGKANLRERWIDVPSLDMPFEDVLRDPWGVVQSIATFVGAVPRREIAKLVDPDHPRNKPLGHAELAAVREMLSA